MDIFEQYGSRSNGTAGNSLKSWTDTRNVRGFPSPDRFREAAFEYISNEHAAGRDRYLPRDLKDGVASILGITPDQRALPNPKTRQPAFNNLVDQIQQEFSQKHIHSGPNGGEHKGKEEPYDLTEYGKGLVHGKSKLRSAELQEQLTPPASDTVRYARVRRHSRGLMMIHFSRFITSDHSPRVGPTMWTIPSPPARTVTANFIMGAGEKPYGLK